MQVLLLTAVPKPALQVADLLAERYQRKAEAADQAAALGLPRLRVPLRTSLQGSSSSSEPLHQPISSWAMLPPDLFSSPRTSSDGMVSPQASPHVWWGDRRCSRSILTLGEQAEVHTQVCWPRLILSNGVLHQAAQAKCLGCRLVPVKDHLQAWPCWLLLASYCMKRRHSL